MYNLRYVQQIYYVIFFISFRHIVIKIDGTTSGPDSFSGPLAKAATGDVHTNDVVDFLPIDSTMPTLPDEVSADLSRDQKLLYRFVLAVKLGHVPPDLAHQKPGPANHARWLTLAIRFLMLYVKTVSPSQDLVTIVTYIQQVKNDQSTKTDSESEFFTTYYRFTRSCGLRRRNTGSLQWGRSTCFI